MQHASMQHKWLYFFVLFILFLGSQNSALAQSNKVNTAPGPVLAYFVGYHSYYGGNYRPGYMYYGSKYRTGGRYWTGWRYVGYGCQKSCQIDQFSGRAIRCKKRC